MRKILIRVFVFWIIFIILLILILLYNPTRSLLSLEKVSSHPLYKMTYYGGYNIFPKTVKGQTKMMKLFHLDDSTRPECSIFTAFGDANHMIYGRNYDWYSIPVLLLFTDPPDGYASVSIADLSFLGFDQYKDISNLSLSQQILLLTSPLITMDGMNEYGVTVGVAAVPNQQLPYDQDKETIYGTTARRLILDHARNINEAVQLLEKYNVSDNYGHMLIADPSGKSVVVEYLDGKMEVLPNEGAWQAITNFPLSRGAESYDLENDHVGLARYYILSEMLNKTHGTVSQEGAMSILEAVSHALTQWSVAYDMSTGDVLIAMSQKYDEIYRFHLKMNADGRT